MTTPPNATTPEGWKRLEGARRSEGRNASGGYGGAKEIAAVQLEGFGFLFGSSLIWFHGSSRSRWSVFVLVRVYTAREAGARPRGGDALRGYGRGWIRTNFNVLQPPHLRL